MEIEFTNKTEVKCDGGQKYGHPLVYYNMGDKDEISCSYCGKIFKKDYQ